MGFYGVQHAKLILHLCTVNRLLTLVAPSCILAVKTDLQSPENMRPFTAIPKAQESGGFKLRCLVVFCDVIRQIRSIDCSIPITFSPIFKTKTPGAD